MAKVAIGSRNLETSDSPAVRAAHAPPRVLSPGARVWQRFRSQRLGYVSLLVFVGLYAFSLAGELFFNDRPLLVYYEGRFYAPLFKDYPESTFGGDLPIEADYNDPFIRAQLGKPGNFALYPLHPYYHDTLDYFTTAKHHPGEPSRRNWLGTDVAGYDVASRLLYGFRISVTFALLLTLSGCVIGIAVGALQGYFAGRIDLLGQRVIEIWSAMPELYLLIIFASLFEYSFVLIFLVLTLFGWTHLSEYVRAEFLRNRKLEYVKAARAMGLSNWQIIWRHVLPNSLTPVITFLPFRMSAAITALASLDFLGIGSSADTPSLGRLLLQGKQNLDAWWISLSAFGALLVTILLLTFIGDALRRALDTRERVVPEAATAPVAGRLATVAVVLAWVSAPTLARADHAIAPYGTPKYPPNFSHFDYVRADAPKGGVLNLSTVSLNSGFDTYNPFTLRGRPAPGLTELVFETLTVYSLDELNVQYGLLAEDIEVAPDFSSATFRLHPEARFSNGDPVTAADVVHSYATLVSREASPRFRAYFADIAQVVELDARTVRFDFKRTGRDLAPIAGSLPVFSRKWGLKPDGTRIPFDQLKLVPPIASGPYLVDRSPSGQNAIYTRNRAYWGQNTPVRRGSFNFDRVVFKLYKDIDGQVAAMRSGDFDVLSETKMRYWCCQYIGKRFDRGELKKALFPHKNPRPMNGYIFNLRREKFQDIRVRQAFHYAYDWEWLNDMIFAGQFARQDSYFANTELAARGTPNAAELALLTPFRSLLEPAVFGPIVKPPSTRPPSSPRDNLRKAAALFAAAGWRNRGDGVLRNDRGEPFTLRISGRTTLLEAFYRNVKRLGVVLEERTNDAAVDRENLRKFNFDFASIALREARSPGPELYRAFHSDGADVPGSENLLGLKSPVVDALIERILDAATHEELVTAARAFDRVMLHHAYVLPWRYLKNHYVIYHERLQRPPKLPDYYGAYEWVLSTWWDGSAVALARGFR